LNNPAGALQEEHCAIERLIVVAERPVCASDIPLVITAAYGRECGLLPAGVLYVVVAPVNSE